MNSKSMRMTRKKKNWHKKPSRGSLCLMLTKYVWKHGDGLHKQNLKFHSICKDPAILFFNIPRNSLYLLVWTQ
jgi:hypothetical protein